VITQEELHALSAGQRAKEFLKAFLRAAGVDKQNEEEASAGCINPALEDPEAWECECGHSMVSQCGGIDVACFRNLMCGHTGICDSWVDQHCTSVTEGFENGKEITPRVPARSGGFNDMLMDTAIKKRRMSELSSHEQAGMNTVDTAMSRKCAV
jgi:hypothetical protein